MKRKAKSSATNRIRDADEFLKSARDNLERLRTEPDL